MRIEFSLSVTGSNNPDPSQLAPGISLAIGVVSGLGVWPNLGQGDERQVGQKMLRDLTLFLRPALSNDLIFLQRVFCGVAGPGVAAVLLPA